MSYKPDFYTVRDLIAELHRHDMDARIAIEDGEFGPLASTDIMDIQVSVGDADDGKYESHKSYPKCVIIGWR